MFETYEILNKCVALSIFDTFRNPFVPDSPNTQHNAKPNLVKIGLKHSIACDRIEL